MRSALGPGGISFVAATAAVNVSNLGFHIVGSRLLGPTQYGLLGALLNLTLFISIPIGAVQASVTQAVATAGVGAGTSRLRSNTVTWSIGVSAVLLLIGPLADRFLHVSSRVPLLLLAAWIPLSAVSALLTGILFGRRNFLKVAVAIAVGVGFTRLLLGWALIGIGTGVNGAMLATVLGQFATLLLLRWGTREDPAFSQALTELKLEWRDGLLALGTACGIAIFGGIDTVEARHYLSAAASGAYAAGANAGRMALFLPAAFTALAFPSLAASAGRSRSARLALRMAAFVVAGVGASVALVVSLGSARVVHLLFGGGYPAAIPIVGRLAWASAEAGLIYLLSFYCLARRSLLALLPWGATAVLLGLLANLHQSASNVAAAVLIANSGLLAAMVLVLARSLIQDSIQEWGAEQLGNPTPLLSHSLDLSVVVPFYNPGSRLGIHLRAMASVLARSGLDFEIIAVSDGSTDGSDRLEEDMPGSVRCIRLPLNSGKGVALRAGLVEGRGRYLGFIDADGELPADTLSSFVELIRSSQPDVLLGSKRHPQSIVVYPPLRRLYSWGCQWLVRLLFRLNVRDTQTGVKLIRRDVVAEVLPRMLEKRFAFDLELLVVARQLGYENVQELPVRIEERFSSTIRPRAVWRMALDTLAIYYRLRIVRFYGPRRRASLASLQGPMAKTEAPDPERQKTIVVFNWRDIGHPNAGGSEVYIQNVCSRWASQGHQVTLFTSRAAGQTRSELVAGVQVRRAGGRITVYLHARRFLKRVRGTADLIAEAINTRPFNTPRIAPGKDVLAIIHQVARDVWRYETPFPFSLVGRYILEPIWLRRYRSVPVATLSESSRESLRSYGLRNVSIVPPGFTPASRLSEIERELNPTIVYVARLTPNKRPSDVLRAFEIVKRSMPAARLWVIGSGPLERRLRRRAGDGVHFLGRVPEDVKLDRLARAHVAVLTSVREGWGLVITEAASVGTPTIGYDVPGIRDAAAASGGVVVEPNPEALARELLARLPLWQVSAPTVTPGGVLSWDGVASQLLRVGTSGGPQSGPTPQRLGAEALVPSTV